MITPVLVYVYLFGRTYYFVCTLRKSMLEVDCELDEPNTSRTTHRKPLSKASGFSLCIFYLYPINAYNNFTIWIYCIFFWDLPN
jgi:hypothetical protein